MSKKGNGLYIGTSETDKVDEYMETLSHPMKEAVAYLREKILAVDPQIGEGIYWNAPTFYFTGKMDAFDPKTYKRYLTGFVFNRQDCIRLVF